MRVPGVRPDVYVCDECEAAWPDVPERSQEPTSLSRLPGLRARPRAGEVEIIREQERA